AYVSFVPFVAWATKRVGGKQGNAKRIPGSPDPFPRLRGGCRSCCFGKRSVRHNLLWRWGLCPSAWAGVTVRTMQKRAMFAPPGKPHCRGELVDGIPEPVPSAA